MYQENSNDTLEKQLAAKKNQQIQFQTVIDQYNYALALLNKEIDQLKGELSDVGVHKKWVYANDWDEIIVNIVSAAGRPLTKEEMELKLVGSGLVPHESANPKQYVYQKILHAQKRERISRCNVAGCRKLYYCLPTWLDDAGFLKDEFPADNTLMATV